MSRTDSPIDYDGPRTEEGFIEFLNEKCGTHRTVGGLLDDKAGRLEQLDALAAKFFEETAAARQTLLKEASDLASALGAGAKHYLRVMEKVVNGSEEYVEKESKRFVPPPFSSVRVGLIGWVAGWRASYKSARSRRRSWTSSRSSRTS